MGEINGEDEVLEGKGRKGTDRLVGLGCPHCMQLCMIVINVTPYFCLNLPLYIS